MKYVSILLFIISVFTLQSCVSEDANKKEPIKKERATNKTKPNANQPAKSKVAQKVNTNSKPKVTYLDLLAKELKLTPNQKNGIARINKEYRAEEQKILKKSKTKKLNKNQTTALNNQRNNKLTKLLGKDLLKKKQNFDIKRRKQQQKK